MARTYSQMIDLGAEAPDFDLPVVNPIAAPADGDTVSLADYDDAELLVVVFTCNHCPYAKHVEDALIETAHDYEPKGVAFVAISSNDVEGYPDDSPENMARRAEEKAYPFAYLYDESQAVARAYGAVCTPDLFIYDDDRRLAYRGRLDATRPKTDDVADAAELRQALDDLLEHGEVTFEQVPSMGCNIKWKEAA